CDAATTLVPLGPAPVESDGFAVPGDHVQVFRNQSVGRRCTVAASGPRFQTLIRTSTSAGDAFAYSTNTSKYRFSSKTPVSISSYSRSWRERWAFVATSWLYGYARCGYL